MSTRATMEPLCIETLSNGHAMKEINEHIAKAGRDVIDRPQLGGKRVVNIQVAIKPHRDDATGMNFPMVSWKIALGMPGIEGAGSVCQVDDRGIVTPCHGGVAPLQTDLEDTTPDNVVSMD